MVHGWRLVTSGACRGLSRDLCHLPSLSVTLGEFVEGTKLEGPVNMLEGGAAIQRDPRQDPAPGKEEPLAAIQAGEGVT